MKKFWSEWINIVNMLGESVDDKRVIIEQYPIELVEQGYCFMCVPLK